MFPRLSKPLGSFARSNRLFARLYVHSFRSQTETAQKRTPFWKVSVGVTLAGGLFYYYNNAKENRAVDLVRSDSSAGNQYDVAVETSVSPFPQELSAPLDTRFRLVAYGTRMVTFLNFKVYALGLYIAEEDVKAIPKVFTLAFLNSLDPDVTKSDGEKLAALWRDPAHGEALTERMLDAGVRYAVRIVPVRNTDFNHLRDGLVKSILAHPVVKKSTEVVAEGLGQLREVFSARKGSVPKDHVLLLERLSSGALRIQYQKRVSGAPGQADTFESLDMGLVLEPSVSRFLMLQYLSPTKPLSVETRDRAVEKLSQLV